MGHFPITATMIPADIILIPVILQVAVGVMEKQLLRVCHVELSGNMRLEPYAGMKPVSMPMEKLIQGLDVPG